MVTDVKRALDGGAMPASAIPTRGPTLPNARTPGSATPAETNDSAG